MKDIMVARIDDRLIHGQVVTAWIKSYPINNILIIDDLLAQDQMMQSIYKAAAPVGVKITILGLESACERLGEAAFSGEHFMLLAKGPEVFEGLLEHGISFAKLVVGGMGAKPGRGTLIRNISVSGEERKCLKRICEKGCRVVYQLVPAEKEIDLAGSL